MRKNELLLLLSSITKRLNKAPGGFLKVNNRGTYNQYYHRFKGQRTGSYLDTKQSGLIKSLAQKKYDLALLKSVNQELSTIQSFLDSYSDEIPNIYSEFDKKLQKMIEAVDMSDEDYVEQWLSIPYTPLEISDDIPIHYTANNERVRSKSEELIANALKRLGIPYKYECPITLRDGSLRYPDFTLLDVKNRKEYYYEHFGMMDDKAYVEKFMIKMRHYEENGICPGINLIMTFESLDNPINSKMIVDTIGNYIQLPDNEP